MPASQLSANTPQPAHSATPYVVAAVMLAVAMAGIGFAYFIDFASKNGVDTTNEDTRTYAVTIAGRELIVPGAWIIDPELHHNGFVEKLDLTMLVGDENSELEAINVTLLPASQAQPSDQLLDRVYLHQFETAQAQGVPGLVGKPLRAVDGYQNETVWYDPLSARPFVAKCLAPAEDGMPTRCLRTVLLTERLAAVYAFDKSVLQNWRAFDAEMASNLERLGL